MCLYVFICLCVYVFIRLKGGKYQISVHWLWVMIVILRDMVEKDQSCLKHHFT